MSQSNKNAWAKMWAIYQVLKYDGGHDKKWTHKMIKELTRPVKEMEKKQ